MFSHRRNLNFWKQSISLTILMFFLAQGVSLATPQFKDAVSRGDFIKMLAESYPENSLLPINHSQMSGKALFPHVSNRLKSRGVDVLENISPDELLTQQEFVRITYAFSGGEPNKSLFEQKLFLKKAGIISSTDIGLATGVDGKVYQTHKGQSEKKQTELAGPVFMDDKFETNDTSKALFTFDDKSTLTMSEDTVININKHVYNPDKNVRETLINASLGWVRFKVTKKLANGSSFKVVTPTATAGVRGTEFVVKVEPGGKTTFLVLEGQIETRPVLPNGKEGKVRFVSAGESQDIYQNGVATDVKKAPPGLLLAAVNKTTKPLKMASFQGVGKGLAKKAAKETLKLAKAETKAAEKLAKAETKAAKKLVKAETKAAKSLAKTLAKGSAKGVAKDAAKLAAKDSAKGAAKLSAKLAAKDSAKGAAKLSAKLAAKDSAKGAAKASAKAAAKDSAKSAAKDSAKDAAKQAAKELKGKGLI